MSKFKVVLAAVVVLLLGLTMTTRHGLIAPTIGESSAAGAAVETQTADTAPAAEAPAAEAPAAEAPAAEATAEEGGGDAAAADMSSSGGGESEPIVAPAMAGNVVYRFYHEEMKSTSLGGMEQFTAEALLYDELNADGVNGCIHLMSGSSETYMTCVWTDNGDGTLSLQTDEFNVFEAKEADGVLTIVGIRYSLGMMNTGAVDIPLAQ